MNKSEQYELLKKIKEILIEGLDGEEAEHFDIEGSEDKGYSLSGDWYVWFDFGVLDDEIEERLTVSFNIELRPDSVAIMIQKLASYEIYPVVMENYYFDQDELKTYFGYEAEKKYREANTCPEMKEIKDRRLIN